MIEKAVEWKQVGELYTTEGTFLEVGTFTDKNSNVVTITEKDIEELLSNIDSPIPIAVGDHGNSTDIGYTTQVGSYGNTKALFKGYSNDPEQMQSAILQGYSSVSPEIDVYYDDFGNPIKKVLKRLNILKNPANPNAKASIHRFAFSAPEVNSIMTSQNQPLNGQQQIQQAQQPPISTTAASVMGSWTNNPNNVGHTGYTDNTYYPQQTWQYQPIMPPQQTLTDNTDIKELVSSLSESLNEVKALKAEIEALKQAKETPATPPVTTADDPSTKGEDNTNQVSKEIIDEYAKAQAELLKLRNEKEEAMKTTCKGIISDLTKLNVKGADKLFSSLPLESRIEALNQFRASIAQTTSMTSPPQSPMESDGGNAPRNNGLSVTGALSDLRLDTSPEYSDPELLKQLQNRLSRKYKNIGV